jgi:RNA polymerase sigma-70 factor, ECF subfamily
VDVSDGDLVRLARAGDPTAFRILVERHLPLARARASRLCSDPGDVDDVVQESFLQAFVALDRLQHPDRFAGWLCGIVLNVHRVLRRRAPLTLLADWPERLHPVSRDGLPSADDLDRSQVLRQAVAKLPAGQRQAVAMFYYADQPAAHIADSPGAAKSSLHKARRRLREYITEHRPDLIPVPSRRTPMVTVRIAHAEPRPGWLGDGMFHVDHVLVVLADDAGGRALPVWLPSMDGYSIQVLLDRPADETVTAPVPEELTARLLATAGVTVTTVDIDELGPEVTAARIELGTAAGTRQVVGRLADGLALAAATGAPVRVADPVMDRLAVPVRGGDLLGAIPQQEPVIPRHERPRRAPRNLGFGDGLAGWHLRGRFLRDVSGSHRQDYSCAAQGPSAVLRSAVPEPYGSACLGQEILAEDYRGRAVTFRAELRTEDVSDRAFLFLQVQTEPVRAVYDYQSTFLTGSHDWASHEITAQVPDGAVLIQFGVTLNGPGRVTLRHADLISGLGALVFLDGPRVPVGIVEEAES